MTDGIKTYLGTSFIGMLLAFNLVLTNNPAQAQDVIRASGGTDISIDSVATGGYVPISGPNIRETSTGQLVEGETIVLTLPDGYEWNTNLTAEDITVETEATGAANTKLEVSFTSISADEAVFTIDAESSTSGNGQGPGRVDIEGLELRPSDTTVPDEGQIFNTGTTGPIDANYGNLSKEAGEADEIRVETESDGSGTLVEEQDITAGVSLEVYAIARDIGGNFVENISLEDDGDWNLTNTAGDITEEALEPADNLRSATFNSEKTGSAQIEAYHPDLAATPSETITVLPREAQDMVITIQPSSTATAGQAFNTQPVLELRDRFDNTVTTDNNTEITANIASGDGTLSGTLTEQASDGTVTFSNLSSNIANTITLLFESPDLDAVISEDITIEAADAADLRFLENPSNTVLNRTIDPPVEVQLLDQFSNIVSEENISVSFTETDGSDIFQDNSALDVDTDSDGVAVFDELNIRDDAITGEYQLTAQFNNINSPVQSDNFYLIDSSDLASFEITATDGSDLGEQEAGASFDVQIRAVDGDGNTFTDFDGTVDVSADADISQGDGETASFTDGELDSHSITLTSSGSTRIYAENSSVDRDGRSNEFIVNPSTLDSDSTQLTSNPSEITADGNSTSEITLQAKDEFGNNLETGGETVWITTNEGSLSSDNGEDQTGLEATDNGDGTYTATLTSGSSVATATIGAFLDDENGEKLGDITVEFISGDLSSFSIILPQDNGQPVTQTAGKPFDITVQALDSNGNIIPDFDGDLVFSTSSEISDGELASGNNFADGELVHSITLTESGENVTIRVEEDNLDEESGTSEEFEVIAADPDGATSRINANPSVIKNDGNSESDITVILRDQFENRIFSQENVSLELEQLELDGNPSSGDPDASISNVTFDATNGEYNATLTSSNTFEVVEISGDFNGTPISDIAEVDIVEPNTWTADGQGQTNTDWTNPENWSLGSVPDENAFVIIPNINDLPVLDLNIEVGSFEIQDGANLELFGGNLISTSGNTEINGNLDILDNTDLKVGGNLIGSGSFTAGASTTVEIGGNISLNSYLAGENDSITQLNGENQQTLSTSDFLSHRLEIRNDVSADASVNLIDAFQVDISQGNTFELAQDADITFDLNESISGDGTFILNNNTFVLRGNSELSNIDASDGTVIFGIRLDEDDYSQLERQEISNLSEMQNAVINNTKGVRTFEDIIVDGDLTLENGELIIASGKSLIAPNQIYNGGELTIRRRISSGQGWRMLGAPINSTFDDLFEGLTVQGIPNSTYPDRQPNLLWYDEEYTREDDDGNPENVTDNQRWRTPGDMSDNIQHSDSLGRGYFFYVFGDVESDNDYNDNLPQTITVSGKETAPENGSVFEFSSVTYTAEADTGWNLVANPFAATIDWDDNDNWTKNNVDDVIYIWDPAENDYLYWNGVDGGDVDGDEEELNNGLIKPFQAFWIKANSENPELSVDVSAKTTGGEFRGKRNEKDPASIGFKLEADTLDKSTFITLSPNGKTGKDKRDAFRLQPFDTDTYLEFYSTFEDGTQLAINNLAREFGREITIPLHVDGYKDGQPINGQYTISWPRFGDVPDSWELLLEDQKNGETINLRKESFYSFDVSNAKAKTKVRNTVSEFNLVENSKSKQVDSEPRFLLRIQPGEDADGLPDEYSIDKNYPNPFGEETTIEFATPEEGRVKLLVYDILGRKVKTLLNENLPADYHEINWNPTQLASGVYIIVMRADEQQFTHKVTYIK